MTPTDSWLAEELGFAISLTERAATVALLELATPVQVHAKPDGSPVTNVDLAVDDLLVAAIHAERPDDAILSEESGEYGAGSRRWILDPVDGTFNLVREHPHWGTHVALEVDGEIVVGVITRPRLGLRWWATRGGGAFCSEAHAEAEVTRLQVSTTSAIASSRVRTWSAAPEVVDRVQRAAVWEEFDMNDILGVAEGRLEAVISSPGEIWDHAPAVLLVEEAGGRFRDHEGGRRLDIGHGHYTNGAVDETLAPLLDL